MSLFIFQFYFMSGGLFAGGPEDLLNFIKKLTGEDDDHGVVFKEIPMETKWREIMEKHDSLRDEGKRLQAQAASLKKLFWSTVENDTGFYENHIHYDREKDMLIVYATDEDQKKMNASLFNREGEGKEKKPRGKKGVGDNSKKE